MPDIVDAPTRSARVLELHREPTGSPRTGRSEVTGGQPKRAGRVASEVARSSSSDQTTVVAVRTRARRRSSPGRSTTPSRRRPARRAWPRPAPRTTRRRAGAHGDDRAGGRLGEQAARTGRRRRAPRRCAPDADAQRHLDEHLGEAAVGEVVRRGDERLARRLRRSSCAERALGARGRPPAAGRRGGRAPRAPTPSPRARRASRRAGSTTSPSARERHRRAPRRRRRSRRARRRPGVGWIADVAGLVVEADVAAGDRDAELEAAVGEAARRPAANCHMTSGSSGEPKLRQLVTASGTAPVAATLR